VVHDDGHADDDDDDNDDTVAMSVALSLGEVVLEQVVVGSSC
jgi:hypothetical protein